VLVAEGSPLHAALDALARDGRCVFFAGLPGTGKSLLIRELALLAHAQGRGIRAAIARWHQRHAGSSDLLIGETPFIGHRLIALARPTPDDAEPVLASATTRFVIPVPSRALRAHMEAERERRAREPQHPREREDAPPQVLRALWVELLGAAVALGLHDPRVVDPLPYDPAIYRRVYERLLIRRHAEALGLHDRLPTAGTSSYDLRIPWTDVVPTTADVTDFIRSVEADYPAAGALQGEIEGWYRVAL